MHRVHSGMRAACLCAAVLLAGCGGEMVFKRGAGPGSMASAQTDCRAATDGEPAYAACMEKQGYVVMGSQDSVFVDGADAPAASPGAPKSDFFVEGTAPAAPIAKPAPIAAPVAPTAAVPAAAVVAAPAAIAPVAKPVDPLEEVDVASWWKLGGSAGQLEAAQTACVGQLGNAHRPAPEGTRVTRAMVGCLREAGWRGIGR